jgi:hypothetical protein
MESRINLEAINAVIEDRVGRSDINYLRANLDELRGKLDAKPEHYYIDSEVGNLKSAIEDLRREQGRLYHDCATQQDIHAL